MTLPPQAVPWGDQTWGKGIPSSGHAIEGRDQHEALVHRSTL